jgi:hypothetical protein
MTNRASVMAVVTAVVLAACMGTPSATPVATETATLGATPTATAGQSSAVSPAPIEPTPTPGVVCGGGVAATEFEPDSIVCVVEGPLRARSRPNLSDDSVIFGPLLENGQLLFVIDGPAEGDGYTWYLVEATPGYVERADGWVVAGEDGTPWLARASVPCPADPSLEDLGSMDAMLRIHCYHAREFTFTGPVEAGPMCGDGGVLKSPKWMAGCLSTLSWGARPTSLVVAIPPDLADELGDVEPGVSFEATITAHMDDPAARTCLPHEGVEADYSLLIPGTVLACRGVFVATSFQRVTP